MNFQQGYTKRAIATIEDVSTDFVVMWTQPPDQDCTRDHRGWEKGKRRKWDGMIEQRIKDIRLRLEEDPDEYYFGPTAVQTVYRRQYPDEEVLPLRTIGQILRDLGLTKRSANGRSEGAAVYPSCSENTIYETLGERAGEADFVGEKYIQG